MITNNIIRFLKNEDSVILNRLGKFSKKTIPSVVEGDMILPPKVIIEFEYLEDGNGFSIIDKISQWESKRLIDADDIINQWVKDLKTSLQNNKNVVFENFGTFYLNNAQQICFDSFVNKELNAEYLGMNPVPITKPDSSKKNTPTVEKTEPIENSETVQELEPIVLEPIELEPTELEPTELQPIELELTELQPIEEELIEQEPIEQELTKLKSINHKSFKDEPSTNAVLSPEEEVLTGMVLPKEITNEEPTDQEILMINNSNHKKRSFWGTFIFVLVILGAITVILLLFKDKILDFYNTKVDKVENIIPLTTPKVNETDQIVTEVDTNQEVVQETPIIESTPVVPPIKNPVEIQKTTSKNVYPLIPMEKGKFYVIAGSFTKESDALKHIKDKKLENYNPILITGQSRIRVCIGIFNTENEALAFVNKVDQTYWVLK